MKQLINQERQQDGTLVNYYDDGTVEYDNSGTQGAQFEQLFGPSELPPAQTSIAQETTPNEMQSSEPIATPVGQLAPTPMGMGSQPSSISEVKDFLATPAEGETQGLLRPGIADEMAVQQQGPQQVVIPGSRGGMQITGKQQHGFSEEGLAAADANITASTQAQARADEATISGEEKYLTELDVQSYEHFKDVEAKALAVSADIKRREMIAEQIEEKVRMLADFKPNRNELFEGDGGGSRKFMAIIGMMAGGALAGLNGGPNYAAQLVQKRIDDNVRDQVNRNSALYQDMVRKYGSELTAIEALKVKHHDFVVEQMKIQEARAKIGAQKAALTGARERAEAERTKAETQLRLKLLPEETIAMAYRAPTPAQILTIDRDKQELEGLLGKDADKKVEKFLDKKISGQANAKIVGEAVQFVKNLDDTTNTLRALMAANGGTLPGYDQILSPTRNPTMRSMLAKLGIEHDIAAADVYKRVNKLIMQQAKEYGGSVTPTDAENARAEVGVTGKQILETIAEKRNTINGELRAAAYGSFLGNSQTVLNIVLGGINRAQGMSSSRGRPR